jgi:GT2 family glycosyltransferase
MKLSIIILNYNTPKLVIDCISSITRFLKKDYEIIIVDNGSHTPVTKQELKKFPNTTLIEQEINLGFGGGNNLGARQAKGDYLWILNSDTMLVDASIMNLISWMDGRPDVGIASPLLFLDPECRQPQRDMYADFQSLHTLVTRKNRRRYTPDSEGVAIVDMVVGAAMVVRSDLYRELGGFDENIFMYLEDDDLCKRAAALGMKTAIYTHSHIVHLQGKSISINAKRKSLYYQSQTYYWYKHHGILPTTLMRGLRAYTKRKNTRRD